MAAAGEKALRVLAETLDLSEQCLQQVRTLSYLLHPPLLDEMGLASALRWFAKGFTERSKIDVKVNLIEDSGLPLPREIATALFRVAQEALSNVHRHSGSATALITLHRRDDVIGLEVADRGRGLKGPIGAGEGVQAMGVGISGMRVRLQKLGGRLEIESDASGTCVVATATRLPQNRWRYSADGSAVMLRILLADDHSIVRRGLKDLIEAHVGWSVCAEAATGREAVELCIKHRPQVAVLDLSMPELNGLEATRRIRQEVPDTEVLVFTMHESEELVREVLAAGARGYLLKSEAADQLIPAVESLAKHRPFFIGRISQLVLEGFLREGAAEKVSSAAQRLTSREREIVQLAGRGQEQQADRAAARSQRQDRGDPPRGGDAQTGAAIAARPGPLRDPQPNHPAVRASCLRCWVGRTPRNNPAGCPAGS